MPENSADLLNSCIEKIETSYEYMLAYAAQGRKTEPATGNGADGPSIRDFLQDLIWSIEHISEGFLQALQPGEKNLENIQAFNSTLTADALSALTVVKMVYDAPTLSSQLIDNLNASSHLRCLLTDIFVLDEVQKIYRQTATQS
jgi:hypothetical protein